MFVIAIRSIRLYSFSDLIPLASALLCFRTYGRYHRDIYTGLITRDADTRFLRYIVLLDDSFYVALKRSSVQKKSFSHASGRKMNAIKNNAAATSMHTNKKNCKMTAKI